MLRQENASETFFPQCTKKSIIQPFHMLSQHQIFFYHFISELFMAYLSLDINLKIKK